MSRMQAFQYKCVIKGKNIQTPSKDHFSSIYTVTIDFKHIENKEFKVIKLLEKEKQHGDAK